MRMKKIRIPTIPSRALLAASLAAVLITALFIARPGAAAALLDGAGYTLDWWTVDGGGATSVQASGYTLGSTAGQPDAGRLEGSGYTLNGGFWAGVAPALHRIFLPLLATGMEEHEPNNTPGQANGPIVSNLIYYGTMPEGDTNDYFYFDLSTASGIEVWLTHIPSGCDYNVVLRNAAMGIVGYSGNVGSADEHILTGVQPAGRYYVQVHHGSAGGSTQAYHLRVVYP